jgi:hypothetical protein
MHLTARSLLLFIVGGAALFCTACGSNNQGKIVGKWKMLSMPGMDAAQTKEMDKLNVYAFFEFKDDGSMTVGAESSDKDMQALLLKQGVAKTLSCKYKLRSGDVVEFYDLPKEMQEKNGGGLFGSNKDRAKTRVKISGDNMTWTDDDGKSGNLVRLK